MASKEQPAKLHYDKQALLADYQQTFRWFMQALVLGIGGALSYFLVFVVYLGGWSHTHSDDYVRQFGARYPIDYAGQKLPMFEDPAKAEVFIDRPKNESQATQWYKEEPK